MVLGDIVTFIRADRSKLGKDLDEAKGQAQSWGNGLASSMGKFVGGAVLGGVTALAAGVAGVGVAAFNTASQLGVATDNIQAKLGVTTEKAEAYGVAVANVYKNNFGDSIADVEQGVTATASAFQRLGEVSVEETQRATEAAFALRDAFGVDVAESASAAVTLMENFGISAVEAYDFIAAGQQKGLNGNDDFLDSIGEYSVQLSNMGASAEEFFSLMETGMQGGVLGTDKAADLAKEFQVRILDGSKLTSDGLKLVGLDVDKVLGGLSNGSTDVIDAFGMVLEAISKIEDPTLRMQAGVALFGTQFEDLGAKAVSGISLGTASLEEMAGSIDKLNVQYDNLPSFFEGLKRRTLIAIAPLGGAILAAFNEALPSIEAWFTTVEGWITDFIAKSDFTWEPDFKQVKLGDLFEWVQGNGVTQLTLGDFFDLTTTPEFTTLKLGDFLDFATDAGKTEINLGDYVSFIYDKSSGGVALTVADVFTFTSGDLGTAFNLGDYLSFFYKEDEKFTLKIGDVYELTEDENGSRINLADWLIVSYEADEIVELKVGDFYTIDPETGKSEVRVGDFYSVVKDDDTTKFTLDASWFFGTSVSDAIQLKVSDFFNLTIPTEMRLGIKDFFNFGGEGEKITQGELFDLETPVAVDGYTLGDFFTWMTGKENTEVKIGAGDLFDFSASTATGIVKLKIGDFIDLEDDSLSGLFDQLNVAPEWMTELQAFLWPGLPWQDKLDTLLAWAWPDAPTSITALITWAWPNAPTSIAALIDWVWPDLQAEIADLLKWTWPEVGENIIKILAFVWPDFGSVLTAAISSIKAFRWPDIDWLDKLINFRFATPAWVDRLLSWTGGAPAVNAGVTSGGSIGGTMPVVPVYLAPALPPQGRSASASSVRPISIVIENAYMNTRQDIEDLAYTLAKRMAVA